MLSGPASTAMGSADESAGRRVWERVQGDFAERPPDRPVFVRGASAEDLLALIARQTPIAWAGG